MRDKNLSNRMILEFYKDCEGQFRWRIKARNGHPIALSAGGYTRYEDCTKGLYRFLIGVGSHWGNFRIKWHKTFFTN